MLERRTLRWVLVTAIVCLAAGAGVLLTFLPAARPDSSGMRTTESLARTNAVVVVQPALTQGTDTAYTVTMSPVGTVRFLRPPQRIVTGDANYTDMLVALGCGSRIIAGASATNLYTGFYAQLAGLKTGIDPLALQSLDGSSGVRLGFDKELLYKLHADIHHLDPLQLMAGGRWTPADIDEITRNVGPFFANRYSRENIYPGKEPYEFYTVWELSDKVGQVYRHAERMARLKAIGDALIRSIQARLPPPEKRPTVGLIYYSNARITPYSLGHGGFGQAQYTAIGARDAFEGRKIATYGEGDGQGIALDLEGLCSVDPDILIMPLALSGGGRTAYEQLLKLRDDPLGRRLKAFQHDRVYPGGTALQGPVFYIFQIEMAAKQVYPELFGRYRDDQRYPPDECLFDREAVAAILRGEADHVAR